MHAVTLARFTDSREEIGRECAALLRGLHVPFGDIRGIGITVRVGGGAGGGEGGWEGVGRRGKRWMGADIATGAQRLRLSPAIDR